MGIKIFLLAYQIGETNYFNYYVFGNIFAETGSEPVDATTADSEETTTNSNSPLNETSEAGTNSSSASSGGSTKSAGVAENLSPAEKAAKAAKEARAKKVEEVLENLPPMPTGIRRALAHFP